MPEGLGICKHIFGVIAQQFNEELISLFFDDLYDPFISRIVDIDV